MNHKILFNEKSESFHKFILLFPWRDDNIKVFTRMFLMNVIQNNVSRVVLNMIIQKSVKENRILLVEDDLVNQHVAKGFLIKLGYSVDVAIDGVDALNKLKINNYELILMDIQMPNMSGIDATKKIRASDSGISDKSIPIIAMTANAMEGDRERYIHAGMNDYLPKPITIQGLSDMLERWLNRE